MKDYLLSDGIIDPNPTRSRTFILVDSSSDQDQDIEREEQKEHFETTDKKSSPNNFSGPSLRSCIQKLKTPQAKEIGQEILKERSKIKVKDAELIRQLEYIDSL